MPTKFQQYENELSSLDVACNQKKDCISIAKQSCMVGRNKYLSIDVVNFIRSFLRQIELQLLELFNTCWRDNNFCYHWDETEILHIRRFEEKIAWFYGDLLCDFSNMIMPQKRKRSTLIISYSQSNHGQWPISIASSR